MKKRNPLKKMIDHAVIKYLQRSGYTMVNSRNYLMLMIEREILDQANIMLHEKLETANDTIVSQEIMIHGDPNYPFNGAF